MYSDLIPVLRPIITDQIVNDPYWLLGFAEGEGSFAVKTQKSKTKLGLACSLRFTITQHTRDEKLIQSLVEYFDCGSIQYAGNCVNFTVDKFSDIQLKIIPFVDKYSLYGIKAENFLEFCKVGGAQPN